MHLSEIFIENFRGFGAEKDGHHLRLELSPGLNVLVGENDSGKSTIVDAIRLVLTTRTQEGQRLTEEDFHVRGQTRAGSLTIRCIFRDLSKGEISRFLEWLSLEEDAPCLIITFQASRRDPAIERWRRVPTTTRAGRAADGPPLEGEIRDFLQATYLRPLRDAEAELSGGRNSRLAQILDAHPDFKKHMVDDSNNKEPATILGIMRQAERRVQESSLVKATADTLNKHYLGRLSLGDNELAGDMGIARNVGLRQILEKLELWLAPEVAGDRRTRRGLGLNNLLFIAAELLLLGGEPDGGVSLLLIEEPEAHLHPQLQMRLMEFLEEQTRVNQTGGNDDDGAGTSTSSVNMTHADAVLGTEADAAEKETTTRPPVQVLVTTHSPNLASKVDIESITLVSSRRCFRLCHEVTKLEETDYAFLRRFLDVTKANLFFARGVAVCEGDSENLLVPVLARKLGRSFSKYGVSIVNVGNRALFRYARIFQRKDNQEPPLRVACITDFDVPSSFATYVKARKRDDGVELDDEGDEVDDDRPEVADEPKLKARRERLCARDGGVVRTFVSPQWTLEHDLALSGLAREVHVAIEVARASKRKAKNKLASLTVNERNAAIEAANKSYNELARAKSDNAAAIAAAIYEPLYRKKASKVETAEVLADLLDRDNRTPSELRALLPKYLVDAIDFVTGAGAASPAAEALP